MRVEYADGIVVWRHSLVVKVGLAAGIAAWVVTVLVSDDLDLSERALFLLFAVLWAGFGWARVWRPHVAATPDGLVVRRAWDAVLVPWANIAGVSRPTIYGLTIRVRVGTHVESAVPAKGPVAMLLGLDSEADRAADLIEERAGRADRAGQPMADS